MEAHPSKLVGTPTTAFEGALQTARAGASATALTVHVRLAGELSRLPAASIAATSNVCERLPSCEYPLGVVHPPQEPPSIRQRYVEPDSEDANRKLASALETVPLGPEVMVVCGATVSAAAALALTEARGFVPSLTSRPSLTPSESVSFLSGFVRRTRTSRLSLRPSRSVSDRRGFVLEVRSS